MKKFLLSSVLRVFLLGFGGISMAYTNVQYYAEEGASTPCYTDDYGSSAKNLMDISEISADVCARPADKQFAGWKLDGSPCDGWEYKKSDYYIAGVNNMVYPAGTNVHCSKTAQHINAYAQRVDHAYDLWIGGVQVTNENQNDVLGDSKVSFNPANSTLSFNNATLSDYRTIRVANDPNYNNRKSAAITTKLGNLVISGDVSIEASAYSIYAINDKIDNGGNLTINGNFKINGEMHIKGSLNVISGSITPAITGWDANGGIYSYNSITFGSNLSRIEIPHGIHAASGITIEQPLEITSPVNGQIEYDGSNYLPYSIGNYSTTAIIEPAIPTIEITGINITGITEPVLGEASTTQGITISPSEGVEILNNYTSWRVRDKYTDDYNYECYMGNTSSYGCGPRSDSTFSYNSEDKPNKLYLLQINYKPKTGYTIADDHTVSINVNGSILTGKDGDKYFIHIKYLASQIPAPVTSTQISSISITGITLPVGGATPTLVGIESQTDGVSVVQSRPFDGGADVMIWFDVEGGHEQYDSFVAGKVYRLYMPLVIANGYTLTDGYTANFGNYNATVDYNTNQLVFEFTATAPATYTIRWLNYSGDVLETDENVTEGTTPTYNGATPTKPEDSSYTYTFDKWTPDIVPATASTDYTATFTATAKQTSSSPSGGSGGGKTVTKETKTDETKDEEIKEKDKVENNENNQELNIPERTQEELQKVLDDGLTQEFHDAYNFGFHYGITTMDSIEKADMNGPLTRIAMGKILSYYAINVLGKKPANIMVPKFPDVDEKLNEEYGGAVDLAYQLGIMGIGITDFRPFDLVSRKELVTAFGRMKYGLADGEGLYYEPHIKKLKEEGIITVDDPELLETRGYTMIQLMRAAKK